MEIKIKKNRFIKAAAVCLMSAVLLLLSMSGCVKDTKKEGTLRIVTTIFPSYDWTTRILGSNPANADVRMLIDNGVDLHSYQPSVDDILLISNCDMFIYVGGESDAWVKDALAQSANKNMVVVNLMELLGEDIREEEIVSGMQQEEEDDQEDEKEYDEHVWLSLKNADIFCRAICDKLCTLDSKNAGTYRKNTQSYCQQLASLNNEYQKAVDASQNKTLLFGDRFPFLYLTKDYGLKYFAAFAGCSAETEASFDTIIFLSGKTDELKLKAILKTEGSDGSVAKTIRDNTKTKDQKILTLHSMQSVTSENIRQGTSYLSVMQDNLKTLKETL